MVPLVSLLALSSVSAARGVSAFRAPVARQARHAAARAAPQMALPIDLTGKVAFVAGVADSTGYGWAIAKALAEAGAKITVGTWPPVLGIFTKSLEAGKFDADMVLSDGSKMVIEKVYALDAVFDGPEDVPDEVKNNKRYAGCASFTISECATAVEADYGKIDILVHSLANGPEVTKPLLETSRKGYVRAAHARTRERRTHAGAGARRTHTRARRTRAGAAHAWAHVGARARGRPLRVRAPCARAPLRCRAACAHIRSRAPRALAAHARSSAAPARPLRRARTRACRRRWPPPAPPPTRSSR